ncbi:hypothetical protein INT47_005227 [Mucor saturninus]|uniref:Uncharacterized protein n=1 Tax=Mucor saturninus TaxID=64648 RepID=A0A8H7R7A3_9FUNG|nr:hypothetical protein INT47_005227 [Mucor saturninus]
MTEHWNPINNWSKHRYEDRLESVNDEIDGASGSKLSGDTNVQHQDIEQLSYSNDDQDLSQPQREPVEVHPGDFGGYGIDLVQDSDLKNGSEDMVSRVPPTCYDTSKLKSSAPPIYQERPPLTHEKDIDFFGDSHVAGRGSRSTLDQDSLHRGSVNTLPSAGQRRGSTSSTQRRGSTSFGQDRESISSTQRHESSQKHRTSSTSRSHEESHDGSDERKSSLVDLAVDAVATVGAGAAAAASSVSDALMGHAKPSPTEEESKEMPSTWPNGKHPSDDTTDGHLNQKRRSSNISDNHSVQKERRASHSSHSHVSQSQRRGSHTSESLITQDQKRASRSYGGQTSNNNDYEHSSGRNSRPSFDYGHSNSLDYGHGAESQHWNREPAMHGQQACPYTHDNVKDDGTVCDKGALCQRVQEPIMHGQNPSYYGHDDSSRHQSNLHDGTTGYRKSNIAKARRWSEGWSRESSSLTDQHHAEDLRRDSQIEKANLDSHRTSQSRLDSNRSSQSRLESNHANQSRLQSSHASQSRLESNRASYPSVSQSSASQSNQSSTSRRRSSDILGLTSSQKTGQLAIENITSSSLHAAQFGTARKRSENISDSLLDRRQSTSSLSDSNDRSSSHSSSTSYANAVRRESRLHEDLDQTLEHAPGNKVKSFKGVLAAGGGGTVGNGLTNAQSLPQSGPAVDELEDDDDYVDSNLPPAWGDQPLPIPPRNPADVANDKDISTSTRTTRADTDLSTHATKANSSFSTHATQENSGFSTHNIHSATSAATANIGSTIKSAVGATTKAASQVANKAVTSTSTKSTTSAPVATPKTSKANEEFDEYDGIRVRGYSDNQDIDNNSHSETRVSQDHGYSRDHKSKGVFATASAAALGALGGLGFGHRSSASYLESEDDKYYDSHESSSDSTSTAEQHDEHVAPKGWLSNADGATPPPQKWSEINQNVKAKGWSKADRTLPTGTGHEDRNKGSASKTIDQEKSALDYDTSDSEVEEQSSKGIIAGVGAAVSGILGLSHKDAETHHAHGSASSQSYHVKKATSQAINGPDQGNHKIQPIGGGRYEVNEADRFEADEDDDFDSNESTGDSRHESRLENNETQNKSRRSSLLGAAAAVSSALGLDHKNKRSSRDHSSEYDTTHEDSTSGIDKAKSQTKQEVTTAPQTLAADVQDGHSSRFGSDHNKYGADTDDHRQQTKSSKGTLAGAAATVGGILGLSHGTNESEDDVTDDVSSESHNTGIPSERTKSIPSLPRDKVTDKQKITTAPQTLSADAQENSKESTAHRHDENQDTERRSSTDSKSGKGKIAGAAAAVGGMLGLNHGTKESETELHDHSSDHNGIGIPSERTKSIPTIPAQDSTSAGQKDKSKASYGYDVAHVEHSEDSKHVEDSHHSKSNKGVIAGATGAASAAAASVGNMLGLSHNNETSETETDSTSVQYEDTQIPSDRTKDVPGIPSKRGMFRSNKAKYGIPAERRKSVPGVKQYDQDDTDNSNARFKEGRRSSVESNDSSVYMSSESDAEQTKSGKGMISGAVAGAAATVGNMLGSKNKNSGSDNYDTQPTENEEYGISSDRTKSVPGIPSNSESRKSRSSESGYHESSRHESSRRKSSRYESSRYESNHREIQKNNHESIQDKHENHGKSAKGVISGASAAVGNALGLDHKESAHSTTDQKYDLPAERTKSVPDIPSNTESQDKSYNSHESSRRESHRDESENVNHYEYGQDNRYKFSQGGQDNRHDYKANNDHNKSNNGAVAGAAAAVGGALGLDHKKDRHESRQEQSIGSYNDSTQRIRRTENTGDDQNVTTAPQKLAGNNQSGVSSNNDDSNRFDHNRNSETSRYSSQNYDIDNRNMESSRYSSTQDSNNFESHNNSVKNAVADAASGVAGALGTNNHRKSTDTSGHYEGTLDYKKLPMTNERNTSIDRAYYGTDHTVGADVRGSRHNNNHKSTDNSGHYEGTYDYKKLPMTNERNTSIDRAYYGTDHTTGADVRGSRHNNNHTLGADVRGSRHNNDHTSGSDVRGSRYNSEHTADADVRGSRYNSIQGDSLRHSYDSNSYDKDYNGAGSNSVRSSYTSNQSEAGRTGRKKSAPGVPSKEFIEDNRRTSTQDIRHQSNQDRHHQDVHDTRYVSYQGTGQGANNSHIIGSSGLNQSQNQIGQVHNQSSEYRSGPVPSDRTKAVPTAPRGHGSNSQSDNFESYNLDSSKAERRRSSSKSGKGVISGSVAAVGGMLGLNHSEKDNQPSAPVSDRQYESAYNKTVDPNKPKKGVISGTVGAAGAAAGAAAATVGGALGIKNKDNDPDATDVLRRQGSSADQLEGFIPDQHNTYQDEQEYSSQDNQDYYNQSNQDYSSQVNEDHSNAQTNKTAVSTKDHRRFKPVLYIEDKPDQGFTTSKRHREINSKQDQGFTTTQRDYSIKEKQYQQRVKSERHPKISNVHRKSTGSDSGNKAAGVAALGGMFGSTMYDQSTSDRSQHTTKSNAQRDYYTQKVRADTQDSSQVQKASTGKQHMTYSQVARTGIQNNNSDEDVIRAQDHSRTKDYVRDTTGTEGYTQNNAQRNVNTQGYSQSNSGTQSQDYSQSNSHRNSYAERNIESYARRNTGTMDNNYGLRDDKAHATDHNTGGAGPIATTVAAAAATVGDALGLNKIDKKENSHPTHGSHAKSVDDKISSSARKDHTGDGNHSSMSHNAQKNYGNDANMMSHTYMRDSVQDNSRDNQMADTYSKPYDPSNTSNNAQKNFGQDDNMMSHTYMRDSVQSNSRDNQMADTYDDSYDPTSGQNETIPAHGNSSTQQDQEMASSRTLASENPYATHQSSGVTTAPQTLAAGNQYDESTQAVQDTSAHGISGSTATQSAQRSSGITTAPQTLAADNQYGGSTQGETGNDVYDLSENVYGNSTQDTAVNNSHVDAGKTDNHDKGVIAGAAGAVSAAAATVGGALGLNGKSDVEKDGVGTYDSSVKYQDHASQRNHSFPAKHNQEIRNDLQARATDSQATTKSTRTIPGSFTNGVSESRNNNITGTAAAGGITGATIGSKLNSHQNTTENWTENNNGTIHRGQTIPVSKNDNVTTPPQSLANGSQNQAPPVAPQRRDHVLNGQNHGQHGVTTQNGIASSNGLGPAGTANATGASALGSRNDTSESISSTRATTGKIVPDTRQQEIKGRQYDNFKNTPNTIDDINNPKRRNNSVTQGFRSKFSNAVRRLSGQSGGTSGERRMSDAEMYKSQQQSVDYQQSAFGNNQQTAFGGGSAFGNAPAPVYQERRQSGSSSVHQETRPSVQDNHHPLNRTEPNAGSRLGHVHTETSPIHESHQDLNNQPGTVHRIDTSDCPRHYNVRQNEPTVSHSNRRASRTGADSTTRTAVATAAAGATTIPRNENGNVYRTDPTEMHTHKAQHIDPATVRRHENVGTSSSLRDGQPLQHIKHTDTGVQENVQNANSLRDGQPLRHIKHVNAGAENSNSPRDGQPLQHIKHTDTGDLENVQTSNSLRDGHPLQHSQNPTAGAQENIQTTNSLRDGQPLQHFKSPTSGAQENIHTTNSLRDGQPLQHIKHTNTGAQENVQNSNSLRDGQPLQHFKSPTSGAQENIHTTNSLRDGQPLQHIKHTNTGAQENVQNSNSLRDGQPLQHFKSPTSGAQENIHTTNSLRDGQPLQHIKHTNTGAQENVQNSNSLRDGQPLQHINHNVAESGQHHGVKENYVRIPGVYSLKPAGTVDVDENGDVNLIKINEGTKAIKNVVKAEGVSVQDAAKLSSYHANQ